jgi:hypothetical protein
MESFFLKEYFTKRKIKVLLFSAIVGFAFTALISNIGIERFIIKFFLIVVFYCILSIFLNRKFNLTYVEASIYSIITPFLIDASVLITYPEIVPLLFPFAPTFLLIAVLLAYCLQKSKLHAIAGVSITVIYLLLSHLYFIPAIIFNIEKKGASLAVNTELIEKKFLNAEGDTVRISGAKIKIIDMFFVGCPPCELKRKMLEELRQELPKENFSIIFICNGRISTFKQFQDYYYKNPHNRQYKMLYDMNNEIEKCVPDLEGYPFEIILNDTNQIRQYSGFDEEAYDLNKKERIELLKKICDE